MAEKLLTVQQAADLRSVHRMTVYNAIKRGDLAPLHDGHRVLLYRRDVERWRCGRGRGKTLAEQEKTNG